MTEKSSAQPLRNRFSIVDLAIDILLLTTTFVVPIDLSARALLADGFLPNFAHEGLVVVGYFGFALYVARMYYSNAVRTDRKWSHRVLFPTVPLLFFTWIIVINIIFSAFSLFKIMTLPIFSSLLLMLEAIGFGFAFGLDFSIERHRAAHPTDDIPPNNFFSLSLPSYAPYVLLTIAIVLPLDYFSGVFQIPTLMSVITVGGACVICYLLGRKLETGAFSKLRMKSTMNYATVAVVSILMVVGFIGMDVLELLARTRVRALGTSGIADLGILFLFGVVPVRIGSILFSKTAFFNKVLGTFALLSYLGVQTGLIDIGWKP